jgi:hypothetical protein
MAAREYEEKPQSLKGRDSALPAVVGTVATFSSAANAVKGTLQIAGAPPTVTAALDGIASPTATVVTAATGSEQAGAEAQTTADLAQLSYDLLTGNASALYADAGQVAYDVGAQAGGGGGGGGGGRDLMYEEDEDWAG